MIVNATPLGVRGEPPPFDVATLDARQVVFDTVYTPAETPLLATARARGARAVNGLGMLVHQAARSFRSLLTGRDAPVEVMGRHTGHEVNVTLVAGCAATARRSARGFRSR